MISVLPGVMALVERVPHKVLLFIPHLQQGGAERQILELMRRLPERFDPILCLYGDESRHHYDDYLANGTALRSLGVRAMGPKGLRRLVRLLRDETPTILHSYRDKANFWARVATFWARVPIVLTSVRNRKQGFLGTLAEYFLQRTSSRVLTNSVGVQEELVEWAGVPKDRVQIIHNFLDLQKFRPAENEDERQAARAQFGFLPNELVLLMPGRLARQKHQLGLAAALRILKQRRALPDHVRIVLAGRRRDKWYSRVVPIAMRFAGVEHHVTYLEPVKEMCRLYHACDAVVMPSLWEGMSNAVLESQACGVPAVVSHAANRDGIVIHDESGFEVPTANRHRLADALQRVIAMSPERRRLMGARGRAHVAARFHPDRILEELISLYDGLLAEKGLT
jgi:glycosyltransferase involved in cell wall biosynthesis